MIIIVTIKNGNNNIEGIDTSLGTLTKLVKIILLKKTIISCLLSMKFIQYPAFHFTK